MRDAPQHEGRVRNVAGSTFSADADDAIHAPSHTGVSCRTEAPRSAPPGTRAAPRRRSAPEAEFASRHGSSSSQTYIPYIIADSTNIRTERGGATLFPLPLWERVPERRRSRARGGGGWRGGGGGGGSLRKMSSDKQPLTRLALAIAPRSPPSPTRGEGKRAR